MGPRRRIGRSRRACSDAAAGIGFRNDANFAVLGRAVAGVSVAVSADRDLELRVLRRLDGVERELGESVEYIRHIARVSLRAFFKFAEFLPASRYRRLLPLDAYHVARIAAARDEDCGTCVQIEV